MGFRGWTNSGRTYTDEKGLLVSESATLGAVAKLSVADAEEPSDDELAPSEMALWLDPTPGQTKLMVKAKDASGSVRRGSLDLA